MIKISLFLLFSTLIISVSAQTNTFPASGSVGIGTLTPAAPLQVEGNLIMGSSAANTYHKLIINGPNTPNNIGSKRDISFEFAAAGSSLIRSYRGSSYDTYLQFLTTPNATNTPVERMHIHHDGNVGIGTITPNNKLEINGTGSGLRFTNLKSESPTTSALTVNADGDVILTSNSGLINGLRFADSRFTATLPKDYDNTLKINFKTKASVSLPSHVSSYNAVIGLRSWSDNSGGKAHELAFTDEHGMFIRSGFDEGWGQWRKLLVETENGRVGIGISTPTEALEVAGNIKSYRGRFTGQTPGSGPVGGSLELREIGEVNNTQTADDYAPRLTFHWGMINSSSLALGNNGNFKFNVQNSTSAFAGIEVGNIFSNGNVAINTATVPTGYKLAVKGNVIAEKLVVKNSTAWPDFVFKKDYRLPSLNEVEQFISKNSHLPEIPSAGEVETNGHDVGEMNRLLLKKVEEITLYLIELKKENQEIKKENQEIKKVNDSLKTRIEKLEK